MWDHGRRSPPSALLAFYPSLGGLWAPPLAESAALCGWHVVHLVVSCSSSVGGGSLWMHLWTKANLLAFGVVLLWARNVGVLVMRKILLINVEGCGATYQLRLHVWVLGMYLFWRARAW